MKTYRDKQVVEKEDVRRAMRLALDNNERLTQSAIIKRVRGNGSKIRKWFLEIVAEWQLNYDPDLRRGKAVRVSKDDLRKAVLWIKKELHETDDIQIIPSSLIEKLRQSCRAEKENREKHPKYVRSQCVTCKAFYMRSIHVRRNSICCFCRELRRFLRNTEIRIRSSYPKEPDIFKTVEEINQYASGNSIECLVCGGKYKFLAPHLRKGHHLSLIAYRKYYGIPKKFGLAADYVKQAGAKRTKKYLEQLKTEGLLESHEEKRMEAFREWKRSGAIVDNYWQRTAAYQSIMQETGKKLSEHPNHPRFYTDEIEVLCSTCGEPAGKRKVMYIITHECDIACDDCKKKTRNKAHDRWTGENIERRQMYARAHYQARLGNTKALADYFEKFDSENVPALQSSGWRKALNI